MKINIFIKRIVLTVLFTFIFGFSTTFGQSPEKMSYQSVIRNASDQLVINQNLGMQISILQGSETGTEVYVETQTPTTNANGLLSIEIGTGTLVSGDFTTIDWSAGPYFIKTETDLTGGISYTITGTSQLLSVPYAFYAKTSEYVINDLVDDADADPANELNTSVVLNGTDLETTDVGGTITTDLSTLVDDADADPNNEIELPGTATIGDVLIYDGTNWVSGKKGYDVAYSLIGTAPTNSIVTVGNMQFRYNSTTDGGYIEGRTVSGIISPGIVYANKKGYYANLPGSTVEYSYHASQSFDASWRVLCALWDGSAYDDRITLNTYETVEFEFYKIHWDTQIPAESYKVFASIGGYGNIMIRAEYFK